ncbi:hypothetical protein THRCLA_07834 [Thraustotheca clavata]|uniref:Uncharacterized protein n=1 Tax=Thraustotheca clavata TaxID=74557 RepID=A0A1V9ZBV2_9STRA|nr:hypothetical protein THRCLA_07834 [Thraustotheca clavata]
MGLSKTWLQDLQAQIKAESNAPILQILQYICDGIQEIVMAQPHDPFDYMAAYIRSSAMLIDEPEDILLSRELHRKQIALGRMRNELSEWCVQRRKALEICINLEKTLFVTNSVLNEDDREFLIPQPRWTQEHWCPYQVEIQNISTNIEFSAINSANTTANLESFVPECMAALIDMRNASPEDPINWLITYFEQKSPRMQVREQQVNQLKLILIQYRIYYESFKVLGPEAEIKATRAKAQRDDLQAQLAERTRLVNHISISKMEQRKQHLMKGRPVLIDNVKLWVPLDNIEPINQYSSFQLQALHRAELILMEADEIRYKAILQFDLEYISSRKIGAMYRCHQEYSKYKIIRARRHAAATKIQLRYESYLYHKAIKLPIWCVVGQQVMVAIQLARRAAIWFEFYRGKDFPAGNFATNSNKDLEHLKKLCRNDDKCAAFASDGSLKRFVPRQLSQLQPFTKSNESTDGLYIKRFPRNDEEVVQSAIVTQIPFNKFGTIEIVYDGTGVQELVAIQKLSLRYTREYQMATDTWCYRDQVAKSTCSIAPEPYHDVEKRLAVIEERKHLRQMLLDEAYKHKVEKSAIKLQCAYRSKRARELFYRMLELRKKELEHQAIVDSTAAKIHAKKQRKWKFWRK